ncbi:DUF3263 domain-containing protein [Streptomyces sp. 4N509B]|uniref:DUF3263 domain-containing protein n=1 Tax=Streptomyces sp. 4N509B TaxID=3457413 RepID=UPI003FCF758D
MSQQPEPAEPEKPPEPAEPPDPPEPSERPGAAGTSGPGELTERERAVLALERRGWPGAGSKERAVRERLGMSPTRYYQLLNALLDDPRALAHDPVTVNRLRRLRQARRGGLTRPDEPPRP